MTKFTKLWSGLTIQTSYWNHWRSHWTLTD